MTDAPENIEKNGVRVLTVLEMLLFLGPHKEPPKKHKDLSSPDEIKNRVLLKIERAEIMSAMIAMRSNAEKDNTTHP